MGLNCLLVNSVIEKVNNASLVATFYSVNYSFVHQYLCAKLNIFYLARILQRSANLDKAKESSMKINLTRYSRTFAIACMTLLTITLSTTSAAGEAEKFIAFQLADFRL